MGCRQSKSQQFSISTMPLYNMLIVGYSGVGKTKILSEIKGEQNDDKKTLEINTLILNKTIKIITFEVSGKAEKTWRNYYSIADIVMFVIDSTDLSSFDKIRQKLKQIDKSIKKTSKIFVVFNKIDLLQQQNLNNDQSLRNLSDSTKFQKVIQPYLSKLGIQSLQHQNYSTKCSGLTGDGIKQLTKKLHTFILPTIAE